MTSQQQSTQSQLSQETTAADAMVTVTTEEELAQAADDDREWVHVTADLDMRSFGGERYGGCAGEACKGAGTPVLRVGKLKALTVRRCYN